MRTIRRHLAWILVLPVIALLWVPFYNRMEPSVAGFPFFYVWIAAWIVITALLTAAVHRWWKP
ncbi:MAG: DUF3311 domain-containing protein [Nevskiaceae bacterium]|nr:MAG: DUF3311 domain-containing protein [Nevskiaceae bacterium]TBR72214.1 MAG: DUF3311 domain-containing protein [Nevskiaceae bacterium]